MEITNRDRQKFKKCIETLLTCDNAECDNPECEKCKKCKFYIDTDIWSYLNKARLKIVFE